ncbi:MAG: hypothetical protein ABJG68_17635 [Crocinitomicaceae bacterium]
MKFLDQEYADIVSLFEEKNIASEQYSFTKKRGQLHIVYSNKKDTFCFYRKTESMLTKDLKFEEVTKYLIGSKKEVETDDWKQVLNEIRKWLDKA